MDRLSRERADKKGEIDRKMSVPLSRKSFHLLLACSIFLVSILFIRSFQLQVIRGESYSAMAERNRFAYTSIKTSRGVIYDRNMEQLVFNRPRFLLVFDKNESEDWEKDAKTMAVILNIDYDEMIEKISDSESDSVVILDNIDQENLVFLEIKTRDFIGFRIEKRIFRDYGRAEIFSHMIGYTGKISPEEMLLMGERYSINDYIGKSGLERSYEEDLKVIPGSIKLERDARGRIHSEEIVLMAESGNNLVLWADYGLQQKIYEELEKTTNNLGSKSAAAIALDPRTGGVLAMVSYPGFDSNIFSGNPSSGDLAEIFDDPRKPLFNRIIAGLYPVGSTIKPLIGLAALEEGIITSRKQFYSPGYLSIPNPWNPSQPSVFADLAPNGWFDLRRAIAFSSNVYFYIIGGGYEDQRGLGPEMIKRYLNIFGWGSPTGIDIPGEKEGFIPDTEWKREVIGDLWRIGDTYNMSIGQGYMSVTPLQVAVAFSTIANQGKLLRPMTVWKVVDGNGNTLRTNETEIINEEMFNSENIRIIREGMRDAVNQGSATLLSSLPVTAAAKTGTAQIPKAGHYHNWITVFAPYDDPEIVITIIIEEVEGIRAATLPVAKEVLEWYFGR